MRDTEQPRAWVVYGVLLLNSEVEEALRGTTWREVDTRLRAVGATLLRYGSRGSHGWVLGTRDTLVLVGPEFPEQVTEEVLSALAADQHPHRPFTEGGKLLRLKQLAPGQLIHAKVLVGTWDPR